MQDLEVFFDRSKQGVWILRKDPTFPPPVIIQGKQMFEAAIIKAWDIDREKAAVTKGRRRRTEALAQLRSVAK